MRYAVAWIIWSVIFSVLWWTAPKWTIRGILTGWTIAVILLLTSAALAALGLPMSSAWGAIDGP